MWWSIILRRKMSTAAAPWLTVLPAFSHGGGGGDVDLVYKLYSPMNRKVVSLHNKCDKLDAELMRDGATKLVGSSHGWLALCNERMNNALFLSNPVSGRRIKLPPPPEHHYRERFYRLPPHKVILSCSPDHDNNDCRAMMLSGPGYNLSICSPGRSNEWTPLPDSYSYEDCVYLPSIKRFLCVSDCSVECWNIDQLDSPPSLDWKHRFLQAPPLMFDLCCNRTRFLVFSHHLDRLYVVTRYVRLSFGQPKTSYIDLYRSGTYPDKTLGFCVHSIDNISSKGRGRGRERECLSCLDGLVMFVGTNESVAVPASEHTELQPDSIYYTDHDLLKNAYDIYGGHDVGIFDYRNKTCSPCYYPCDQPSFKRIHPSPTWFTPTIHN